jgi:ribosomal protein L40E
MALLKAVHDAPEVTAAPWICPKCHAEVPANFETCWSCQTKRPRAT